MPLRGGAAKAMRAMQRQYGAKRGAQIFYAKANSGGGRGSMHSKAQSFYKKGGRQK